MIQRHENFPSRFVKPRNLDVWRPPDYETNASHYPVLYMHDGQNIFPGSSDLIGTDWGVKDAMLRLMKDGMRGAIVVGIWHSEIRWREYMPQKPYYAPTMKKHHAFILSKAGGKPISDLYLKFLVEEVKPFIDRNYRTLPDQQNTFVMGSSMGGLVSLYAISEYPKIFGGAGCVSTHWIAGEEALVDEMAMSLPDPDNHKLYFDYGTETQDAYYEPFQRLMDSYLLKAGYEENKNWVTKKFPGAEHNEESWRERVDIPLKFLLS
jgi:predicted alpha/beta superfamily hydrolase